MSRSGVVGPRRQRPLPRPVAISHRVILRPPPPSGRGCWFQPRRRMTRFLLFHQTQDTTQDSPSPKVLSAGKSHRLRGTSTYERDTCSPIASAPTSSRDSTPTSFLASGLAFASRTAVGRETSRNIGWLYWLPNPLFPVIWNRVAVPKNHPGLRVEEFDGGQAPMSVT